MTYHSQLFRNGLKVNGLVTRRQGGFTVVDILVGLAIASVLMVAMVSLFTTLGRSYTTQSVAAGVQHVTRAGIDEMVMHIRMAGFNPLRIADVGIQDDYTDKMIRFTADINASGVIGDADDENIAYIFEDNKLKRQVDGVDNPKNILVDNVSDFALSYLTADEKDPGDVSEIRTVIVSMTVTEPAGRGGALSRTYATRVRCRNIGL
jgi:type II secretory pathway component PulJ